MGWYPKGYRWDSTRCGPSIPARGPGRAAAAMAMLTPPFFGTVMAADEAAVADYFRTVAAAIDIPIMIQDAPLSGTRLSAGQLAELAREIPAVQYVKIETPGAAAKLREVIRLSGPALPGPFDGEESVTLLPDLDAGAGHDAEQQRP